MRKVKSCSRKICRLLILPLVAVISVISALSAMFVVIISTSFVCLLYKFFWRWSPQGRFQRLSKKFASGKENIKQTGQRKRAKLSRKQDQRNIKELVSIIQDVLDHRKNEIMADRLVLIKLLLRDCLREQDFHTAMDIYRVMMHDQQVSLNDRVGSLVSCESLKVYRNNKDEIKLSFLSL